MPDLHQTLERLHTRGFVLCVCTNQPDVSRGWQSRSQVDEFHALILRELPVTQVYACFHDNAHDCDCRKPKPGMLLAAALAHDIDCARSFMVGDRPGDIEAGRAAGCTTIYLRHPGKPAVSDADHEISALSQLLPLIR